VLTEVLVLRKRDYEKCAEATRERIVRQRSMDVRRILASIGGPSFRLLPELLIDKLARVVRKKRIPARTILMHQNTPQAIVLLASAGQVRLIRDPDPAPPPPLPPPPAPPAWVVAPPPGAAAAVVVGGSAHSTAAGFSSRRRPFTAPTIRPPAGPHEDDRRKSSIPGGGQRVGARDGRSPLEDMRASLARMDAKLREITAREAVGDLDLHARLFNEPSQRQQIRDLGRPIAHVGAPLALGAEALFASSSEGPGPSSPGTGNKARFTVLIEEDLDAYELPAADLLGLVRFAVFKSEVQASRVARAR